MKQARVLGGHTRKGIGSFKKTPASLYTHIIVYRKGRKVRLPRPEVLS